MTPETVAAVAGPRTRAAIVVHLFGKGADVPGIAAALGPYGASVIEDLAQSIGGELGGSKQGSFGEFAVLSFDDKKIIPGRGGILLSRGPEAGRAAAVAQAALPSAPEPAAAAASAQAFNRSARELYDRLRAERLARPSRELAEDLARNLEKYRALYLARPRAADAGNPALAESYARLGADRRERYRRYLAYEKHLSPEVSFVHFKPEEVCWRLPILLDRPEKQAPLVQKVRAQGALASDHYFPSSWLFGDDSCANAREIGLRVLNLWVDSKTDEALIPAVCTLVNSVCD
jgi:dTDP-4-amino-4,6-dideoxygalactose transaminase